MENKVNLDHLKHACDRMSKLIEQMQNPDTDSSGARGLGFAFASRDILNELLTREELAVLRRL